MKHDRDVIVVGAGLSGMMAGIQAARRGLAVLVLERKTEICPAFRASAMGEAAVSNAALDIARFHGRRARFVSDALTALPPQRLHEWFQALGVTLQPAEHYGLITGKRIPEAMQEALEEAGGELRTGVAVAAASRTEQGFEVSAGGELSSRFLVLATGAGRDAAGLALSLGHSGSQYLPAQVPLTTLQDWPRELSGLWMDARLRLLSGERAVLEREGSLLFTGESLSGEVVFNISGEVAARLARGESLSLEINFYPTMSAPDVAEWMFRVLGEHTRMTALDALDMMLPARLATVFLRELKVKRSARAMHIEQRQRDGLLARMLANRVGIIGTAGAAQAESKRGGVDVREVNPRTFASRICDGLYLAGRVLDVSADWGGFEQHYALASGYLAGRALPAT